MAIEREDPYGAFNFQVTIVPQSGGEIRAGFSDVSGLSTDISYAEYREGSDPSNAPRKIPNTYKAGDVTLKRGLIGSLNLWEWVQATRQGDPKSRADVVVQLMAEDGSGPVAQWNLTGARPSKWNGPTLAAKGGGEVAMEELTLVVEDIVYE
jgi:phage tail-like protein